MLKAFTVLLLVVVVDLVIYLSIFFLSSSFFGGVVYEADILNQSIFGAKLELGITSMTIAIVLASNERTNERNRPCCYINAYSTMTTTTFSSGSAMLG